MCSSGELPLHHSFSWHGLCSGRSPRRQATLRSWQASLPRLRRGGPLAPQRGADGGRTAKLRRSRLINDRNGFFSPRPERKNCQHARLSSLGLLCLPMPLAWQAWRAILIFSYQFSEASARALIPPALPSCLRGRKSSAKAGRRPAVALIPSGRTMY